MKMDAKIWIKLESPGRPQMAVTQEATVHDAIILIAKWLNKLYMGSCVNIKIARTRFELDVSGQKNPDLDSALDDFLKGLEPDESDQSAE